MSRLACSIVVCAVSWATAALASPSGGVWSGPVEPTGSTFYWNPASLTAGDPGWASYVDLTGVYFDLTYSRPGLDPFKGDPFDTVGFSTPGADFAFALQGPSPWPWLRIIAGGFSPSAAATDWPADGPQRYHLTRSALISYVLAGGVVVQPSDHWGISVTAGGSYTLLHMQSSIDFGAFANNAAGGIRLFEPEDPTMEAKVRANASGWSRALQVGGWGKLGSMRFGANLTHISQAFLTGDVSIQGSDTVNTMVPGFALNPEGDVGLPYPIPWFVNAEIEYTLGLWQVAVLGQFANKSVRQILLTDLTETDPDFLESTLVTINGLQDDWLVGGRVTFRWDDELEVGGRIDVDPRHIPTETINAGNIDFTTVNVMGAARWQYSEAMTLTGGLGFLYASTLQVTDSLFNPSAERDSGFALPTGNGEYTAYGLQLLLSMTYRL